MNQLVIKRSSAYIIRWLVMLTMVLLLGLLILVQGGVIPGLIGAIGALISIVLFARGLSDDRPRVILDDEGIRATEFQPVKISLDDIKQVKVIFYPRVGRIITFELKDEAKYTSQLTIEQLRGLKIERAFGVAVFHIKTAGLDHSTGVYL